jgi:hypothetical protein
MHHKYSKSHRAVAGRSTGGPDEHRHDSFHELDLVNEPDPDCADDGIGNSRGTPQPTTVARRSRTATDCARHLRPGRETPKAKVEAPSSARPTKPLACRWCGSKNIVDSGPKGPHWAKLVCAQCHRCVGFKKTPSHVVRAKRFVLDSGPYKGKRLGELLTTENGRVFLRSLAQDARTEAGRIAATLLQRCLTNDSGRRD